MVSKPLIGDTVQNTYRQAQLGLQTVELSGELIKNGRVQNQNDTEEIKSKCKYIHKEA